MTPGNAYTAGIMIGQTRSRFEGSITFVISADWTGEDRRNSGNYAEGSVSLRMQNTVALYRGSGGDIIGEAKKTGLTFRE